MATGTVKTEMKNRKFEIIIYEATSIKSFYGHAEIAIDNIVYSFMEDMTKQQFGEL